MVNPMKLVFVVLSLLLIPLSALSADSADLGEMSVFEKFAMDPAMSQASISPDGTALATIQRLSRDGDKYLMIYDAEDLSKEPIRLAAKPMEITSFFWANNDRLVVTFRQEVDTLKDEFDIDTRQIFRVASIDRAGKKWVQLPRSKKDRRSEISTIIDNFRNVSLLSRLRKDDDHILLLYDDDQNNVRDVFKVNVANGKTKLVYKGRSGLTIDSVDSDGEPRLASSFDSSADAVVSYARLKGEKKWIEIGRTVAGNDATSTVFSPQGFFSVNDPNELWVVSNHDADTAGVFTYDVVNQEYKTLEFRHPRYDATGVTIKFDTEGVAHPVAFSHHGKGPERYYFDPQEKALTDAIDVVLPDARNRIVSRSDDDSILVISSVGPKSPQSWHMLTNRSELVEIGKSMPFLTEDMLSPVKWIRYKARDGLEIPALVTIPKGKGPFPAVVHPHGGPVARDNWGFDLWAQLLANQGYVVIQPQFRISQGFGRNHLEVGYAQWGYTMQDDLEDAAQYLVEKKLASDDQVAIFGWSYGGYASFVGSLRDPNPFKCAIAGAGVADVPYFRAWLSDFGSFTDKTYRKTVDGLNPLDMADSVDVPILVIHGDLDERVPVAESRKFVSQLKKYNKQHKYIELKGANHFFGTIFYEHWMEMFPAMIDWLDNTCDMKSSKVASIN